MTTTSRPVRTPAVRRLIYLLDSAAPNDVTVSRGIHRDEDTVKHIAIDRVLGSDTRPPTMKAGRKTTEDPFTIEVDCIVWDDGSDDFLESDERAEALAAFVSDTLAEHSQLDDHGEPLPGVLAAYVSRVDGPNPWQLEAGTGSVAVVTVSVLARIH